MFHIDTYKLAVELLNSTLGLDDIPLELHGRLATTLMILDPQEGEDFYGALHDAYEMLGKDLESLEELIEKLESQVEND